MNYDEQLEAANKKASKLNTIFLVLIIFAAITIFIFAAMVVSQQEELPPAYQEVPVYHDSDPYRP